MCGSVAGAHRGAIPMYVPQVRRRAMTVDLSPESGSGPQDRSVQCHVDSAKSARYDIISTNTRETVCHSDEKEKADP